jgi:DNA (cytosine-5)-methyltransferase 1
MKRFSCVSLFSGCGGLDLGLRQAGFDTAVCVEMSADSCESLRANAVAPHIIEREIANVTGDEILAAAGIKKGELDLLAGGPPCPPYSKSRFYRKEKPRALGDPTSDTLFQYLRMLDELRPKVFLLENVPGLAYKVHADAINAVLTRAAALGYQVQYEVLNAANYGVPQIRERLFIVGVQPGFEFMFPRPTHAEPASQLSLVEAADPWITAGDVLSDQDTEDNAGDEGHYAGGQFNSLLAQIPPGDNYLFFTAKRGHPNPLFKWRSRYWSFLLKLSPDKPAWTIQARRSNNMGPFHWRNRILRISEIKRLQTFPDEYTIAGNVESAWRQIGNAVPPKLTQVLGTQIAKALSQKDRQLKEAAHAGHSRPKRERRTEHRINVGTGKATPVRG